MGHAGDELADRGHALALDQRGLRLLEIGEGAAQLGGARLDVDLEAGALLRELVDGAQQALAHALDALAEADHLDRADHARHRGVEPPVGHAIGGLRERGGGV